MNSFARLTQMAAGAASIATVAASTALAGDKMVMTLPTLSAGFAPYLVAIEKGYYAEEGLDIERLNAPGGTATPALLSGTVDVSTSAAAALSAIMRGGKLKIVYTMMDRPPYQLWSTASDLKALQDLKGKSVGVPSRGDTYEIAMRLTLKSVGMSPDWVAYTPLGGGPATRAAIQSGSLPAAIISSEEAEGLRDTPALQRGHLIVNMFNTVRMPQTGAAVSDKLLSTNPGQVKRYLRGTMKGMRFMRAFPAETIAYLKKYLPGVDNRAIEIGYRDIVASLTDAAEMPSDLLREDMEVRAALLSIPPDKIRPVEEVYDYRLLREANAELDRAGWKPAP